MAGQAIFADALAYINAFPGHLTIALQVGQVFRCAALTRQYGSAKVRAADLFTALTKIADMFPKVRDDGPWCVEKCLVESEIKIYKVGDIPGLFAFPEDLLAVRIPIWRMPEAITQGLVTATPDLGPSLDPMTWADFKEE